VIIAPSLNSSLSPLLKSLIALRSIHFSSKLEMMDTQMDLTDNESELLEMTRAAGFVAFSDSFNLKKALARCKRCVGKFFKNLCKK